MLPPGLEGNIDPLYEVLAVLYAPPGYLGTPGPNGAAPSIAEYSSESKAGTSTSTAKSFKDSNTVSATLSTGAFGSGTSVGFSVEASTAKEQNGALEITKDAKTDLKVPGPPTDGIDHAYDEIWIALNPSVSFTSQEGAVSWSLQATPTSWRPAYLYIGWLKDWIENPSHVMTNPVGVQLQAAGFKTSDYQNILSLDPFANGTPNLNSPRFTELSTAFPYEPPYVPYGQTATTQPSAPLQTFSISNESKQTNGTTDTNESEQSITVTAKASGPGASVAMSFQNQMTWTYETSKSQSADGTQAMTISIGTPSASYTTPLTTIAVYWDNIWSSFAFVPVSLAPESLITGTLSDRLGKPLSHRLVTLTAPGIRMRTYTTETGKYSFSNKGIPVGRKVLITAGPERRTVAATGRAAKIDIVAAKPF